jgi:Xaa-Pro aminopeptidase
VIFAQWQTGATLLVTSAPAPAVADDIRRVETYSIQRTITRPFHDAVSVFIDGLPTVPAAGRIAVERAAVSGLLETRLRDHFSAHIEDATGTMLRLRKRKEPDEVEEVRASARLCHAAYDAARPAVRPGSTEIDVYLEMHGAITRAAGTVVPFPGDFACGTRGIREGGWPTKRRIERGDLYILDLFPAPAFYAADLCRSFAAGPPTDEQCRAWELVSDALRLVEGAIRPGVLAKDVYRLVKDFLDGSSVAPGSFWHHVGHGIGYRGHEAPRIIPGANDTFELGDVIALEPGVYSETLMGGVRLEDDYLVRETGIENLLPYQREL